MITVDHLSLSVTRRHRRYDILKDVTFEGMAGETVAVMGGNGVGKTSLLRVLGRLIAPTTGAVRIRGRDLLRDKRLLSDVAYCPEGDRGITFRYTGRENVELYMARQNARLEPSRLADLVEAFDMSSYIGRLVDELSKGTRQKLCLIGPLMLRRPVLLLDEPTAALDSDSTEVLIRELYRRRSEGGVTIVATHDLRFAESVCTRACVMTDGELVANVSPSDVKNLSERSNCTIITRSRWLPSEMPAGWEVSQIDSGFELRAATVSVRAVEEMVEFLIKRGVSVCSVTRGAVNLRSYYRRHNHADIDQAGNLGEDSRVPSLSAASGS